MAPESGQPPAQKPGWLDGLDFTIFNIGSDPGGGGGAGGGGSPSGQGFTMSADDARAMLKMAKSVRDDFGGMRDDAIALTRITPRRTSRPATPTTSSWSTRASRKARSPRARSRWKTPTPTPTSW
jgi:hypothetical protein